MQPGRLTSALLRFLWYMHKPGSMLGRLIPTVIDFQIGLGLKSDPKVSSDLAFPANYESLNVIRNSPRYPLRSQRLSLPPVTAVTTGHCTVQAIRRRLRSRLAFRLISELSYWSDIQGKPH